MKVRQGVDGILVGINTVLADDPSLTVRMQRAEGGRQEAEVRGTERTVAEQRLRRIVLDANGRTPLVAKGGE